MRSAERSLIVFGVYLAVVGLSLVFVPGPVLRALDIPAPGRPSPELGAIDVWVRVVGVLAFALACYFVAAGRNRATWFMYTSIVVRLIVPGSLLAFVVFDFAPQTLLLFAMPDLAGAAWTAWALGQREAAAI